ncbi:hypothetical protein BGZ95_006718 [Linnemannia exigua]|uniref:Vacuole protein n=1 Tax=Linnemannia exigua TaxID=604196 RepID=A0AAD4DHI8_9FUNG|nr:hypothetical protein BGZ95_006718 [Linnemannia exigua]
MSQNDWKRQKVQDHKFDFIDVEDYVDNSPWRKFKYSLVFAIVIKGILIYCADLWTAVNLLVSKSWTSNLGLDGNKISFQSIDISFEIYKWIFAACIVLSFILLAWDMKKATAIIQSRDISYAFTSMIAYRYYAIKSYAHFCLFQKIHNSKKQIDEIAFFCFFTFRGWKRLMFADGPRQVINGMILIKIIGGSWSKYGLAIWDYNLDVMQKITVCLMMFTLTLWIISVLLMFVAVVLYIPLVIHIQGNLKEYCCHKIDKRIDEIVRKKAKERAQEAAKNQKNGKGGDANLPKATLPNINLLDEGDQQYDFADDQSEISDAYSAGGGGGGGGYGHYPPKPQPQPHGHRRQPSDTSTVLSGSNQGSVVGGYGARTGKPHPLQQGPMLSREAGLGNGNNYADTVMMKDMSGVQHRGGPYGGGGGYPGGPTGLGGGLGVNPGGSVVGGGSVIGGGPSYVDQQRGRYQQHPSHQNRPYN